MPDERLGEVCAAFIVAAPSSEMSETSLIAWSRENMANYKVPRRVIFTDVLPLNASGKVLKTTLRTML
jgi:acyl-CoA synthetase (AMP-forming)/AMP-acid ligase II